MKYIVALDQGTTSSRAIVFDHEQNIVATGQKEFRQIYPESGWVEHDPMELWATQYGVLQEALIKAGITLRDVAAIGVTNQRETRAGSSISARRRGLLSMHTFPPPKSAGFSIMCPARGSAPAAASCCLAPSTRGSSGI